MKLRDHNESCGHPEAFERLGPYDEEYGWGCIQPECPGGRLVDIDYEAAGRKVWENFHPDGDTIAVYNDVGRAVVDAALGVDTTERNNK